MITSLRNTQWKLTGFINSKAVPTPVIPETQLTANFDESSVGGSGGVNTYTASYTTTKDIPPSKISIKNLIASKIAGPEHHMKQEQRFFDGLLQATDISTITEEKLTLIWNGGAGGLEFSRVKG
jgi:heat shock protein HslJ